MLDIYLTRYQKVFKYAKGLRTFRQRSKVGASLYYAINDLGGLDALRKIQWDRFFIIKENTDKFYKGQRVKRRPKDVKVREITYIKDAALRQAFSKMAKTIELTLPEQIGFATGKSIHNARYPNTTVKKMALIDLENAFGQIQEHEIIYIFHKVFRLRRNYAIELTKTMVRNGTLVQGHPMAPAIFNIMSIPLISRLSKIITVRQYADDIILYSKYEFISHRLLKFIRQIFIEEEWQINLNKLKFNRKWFNVLGLHIDFSKEKLYTKARGARKNLHKIKRQMNYTTDEKELQVLKGKFRWFSQFWDNLNLDKHLEFMSGIKYLTLKGGKTPPNGKETSIFITIDKFSLKFFKIFNKIELFCEICPITYHSLSN